MFIRKPSPLAVGAFVAALGAITATAANAQEFTAQQKKIQAEHTAIVKSGKLEPCFRHGRQGPKRLLCRPWYDLRGYQHD